jgi:hypothetical protein
MQVKLLSCAGALMTTVSLFVVRLAAVSPPQEPAGDRASGRALFESSGCLDCHRIGEMGSRVAPDLSDVGDWRSTDELRRALLTPDEQVLPEHPESRILTTASDLLFSGGREGHSFALDARTGQLLWKVNLGGPLPAGRSHSRLTAVSTLRSAQRERCTCLGCRNDDVLTRSTT